MNNYFFMHLERMFENLKIISFNFTNDAYFYYLTSNQRAYDAYLKDMEETSKFMDTNF